MGSRHLGGGNAGPQRMITCVPRTAPNFSVRPPSVSIRHQRPEGGSSSPLPSTSVRDGGSASGVVNVAIVFARPKVLSSKSSAPRELVERRVERSVRGASAGETMLGAEHVAPVAAARKVEVRLLLRTPQRHAETPDAPIVVRVFERARRTLTDANVARHPPLLVVRLEAETPHMHVLRMHRIRAVQERPASSSPRSSPPADPALDNPQPSSTVTRLPAAGDGAKTVCCGIISASNRKDQNR